jgi:predicted  nucleic acid-binding Zn-ribbon protein
MTDSYWFHKKWGLNEKSLEERIVILENHIKELQEKYSGALEDIKRLEEENIETSNCLYELMNSIDAVDARIDILTLENWKNKDV